eukprot:761610-Hanusia_phi.AAC.1
MRAAEVLEGGSTGQGKAQEHGLRRRQGVGSHPILLASFSSHAASPCNTRQPQAPWLPLASRRRLGSSPYPKAGYDPTSSITAKYRAMYPSSQAAGPRLRHDSQLQCHGPWPPLAYSPRSRGIADIQKTENTRFRRSLFPRELRGCH